MGNVEALPTRKSQPRGPILNDSNPHHALQYSEPIRLAELSEALKRVRNPALRSAVLSFQASLEDVQGLLQFPEVMIYVEEYSSLKTALLARAIVNTKYHHRSGDPGADREMALELDRLYDAEMKKLKGNPELPRRVQFKLGHLLTSSSLERPLGSILKLSVVSLWTAAECLAKDAWEIALNELPVPLGQRAFSALSENSEPDGISKRHVEVGLLARHGFDLRGKLGTLLAEKFDFTSASGIQKAYKAAFGAEAEPLVHAITQHKLEEVEWVRNLISHLPPVCCSACGL